MSSKNVLITGGAGYIGSLLCEKLLEMDYYVRILDTFDFGIDPIKKSTFHPSFKVNFGDIRNTNDVKKSLEAIDYVIHLAGIVGDPACAIQADKAVDVNFNATKNLALISKKKNIKKFIFASTCSVYGASKNKILTEESELNPVSLYGETKIDAETAIFQLMNDDFKPTVLRFGTLYGLSYRPRFDLVINFLTKKMVLDKKGKIFGGDQWRPFVHVRDVVKGLALILESPIEKIGGEVFNVGVTKENYQMKDIGKIFEDIFIDVNIEYVKEIKDERSYNVSFKKFEKNFNFKNDFNVRNGIIEIKNAIEKGIIKNPDDEKYKNYNP